MRLARNGQLNLVVAEDKAMGLLFHGAMGAPFLPSKIWFLEEFSEEAALRDAIDKGMAAGADHYRVKAVNNREHVDLMAYKLLLKAIYGISLP